MTNQLSCIDDREVVKKKQILDWYENNHELFLEEARRQARYFCHRNAGLAKHRIPHTVTADDIRPGLYIERDITGKNNVMGAVFRKGFIPVGRVRSRADGGHSREIKIWTLSMYYDVVKQYLNKLGLVIQ